VWGQGSDLMSLLKLLILTKHCTKEYLVLENFDCSLFNLAYVQLKVRNYIIILV